MQTLSDTIYGVVRNMRPAMICMCEVGDVSHPLTEENMQQVANQTMHAWRDAATEHVELHRMYEVGAPYMTVYDVGQVLCSCHRILRGLYAAQGQPRTAQAFLCSGPGGVTVDTINVHAPSGQRKLTDQQRRNLITTLLRNESTSMPGHAIGRARFLIGGDMNTGPHALAGLLQDCRQKHVLVTQEKVLHPLVGRPGDVCFLGGFSATCLTTTARNHDPQHVPYGICWDVQQQYASASATEQPFPTWPAPSQAEAESATPQRAASSSCAPAPPTPVPTPAPPMPAAPMQAPATLAKKQTTASGHATEQPLPAPELPASPALAKRPPPTPATLASNHSPSPTGYEETAAAATEHSEEAAEHQEISADQKMVYSIVNEFLGQMTFDNPEAETLLLTALADEVRLAPSMQEGIEKVFSPIFFNFPRGLTDRSVWESRDTGKYIGQWHEYAAWRTHIDTNANAESTAATEHGKRFNKKQVSQIFKLYMDEFKTTLQEDQLGKKWAYYKSCCESKMRRDCGSAFVANAIWEIGLPRLPPFATEQRGQQLSQQALDAVPGAIHDILNWLDLLADALSHHKATQEYATALRKSGVTHGQSGLNATELEKRTAIRKAKFELRTGTKLALQLDDGELTHGNWQRWQETLVHAYWDGSLRRRLEEVTRDYNADPMCRTPSVYSTR